MRGRGEGREEMEGTEDKRKEIGKRVKGNWLTMIYEKEGERERRLLIHREKRERIK